jgi:chemotaxis protein CheX
MTVQQATKAPLDAKLVNAISTSVVEVLQSMASTQVKLKNITAKTDYSPMGDVSAVIGVMGDNGDGMVALSFNEPLARLLVARLLGISPDDLSNDDASDGIGELVNMITGRAKTSLSEESDTPYKLSLPTVIKGRGHEIASRPKNNPYLLMFFDAEGQEFTIQVTFKYNG